MMKWTGGDLPSEVAAKAKAMTTTELEGLVERLREVNIGVSHPHLMPITQVCALAASALEAMGAELADTDKRLSLAIESAVKFRAERDSLRAENERLRKDFQTHVGRLEGEKELLYKVLCDAEAERDSLRLQVEALRKERDDWAAKWHKVRAELAELKYPGMKGEVRAAMGEPTGKDLK